MTTGWALFISGVLLLGNALFVAAEFALVASKRHRLEEAAAAGGRAAKAALRGSRELSLMLAGAQLGITLCTLGIGALAEPAIAHQLDPVFRAVGIPEQASYPAAFVIAVALVVFLHLVVGEMMPKSWAISHPERSAVLLALPFRAFTRIAHPAITALNGVANAALRAVKVTPQDTLVQVHRPEELRMLIRQSGERNLLPPEEQRLLTRMLQLQNTLVRQVMTARADIVAVSVDTTAEGIEAMSRDAGRSRLAVTDASGGIVGIVHVRDALRAHAPRPATARDLMTVPFVVSAGLTAAAAVRTLREHRTQLALVDDNDGVVGLVAMEDLLEEVIGNFDDETDVLTPTDGRAPHRIGAGRVAAR